VPGDDFAAEAACVEWLLAVERMTFAQGLELRGSSVKGVDI
jgi:hypothetical protein